jgi:hypothetical protein
LRDIQDSADMEVFLVSRFPVGSPQQTIEAALVKEMGATAFSHPHFPRIRKYVYDINLCQMYIYRWNISADYDAQGRLVQMYLNGRPVHQGAPDFKIADTYKNEHAMIQHQRKERPEASMGEYVLHYVALDRDGDVNTLYDQRIMGAVATRANPYDMGKLRSYEVDGWRSIFDSSTVPINNFNGDCAAIHEKIEQLGLKPTDKGASYKVMLMLVEAMKNKPAP